MISIRQIPGAQPQLRHGIEQINLNEARRLQTHSALALCGVHGSGLRGRGSGFRTMGLGLGRMVPGFWGRLHTRRVEASRGGSEFKPSAQSSTINTKLFSVVLGVQSRPHSTPEYLKILSIIKAGAYRVHGLGRRVQGCGCRVWGIECRVKSVGALFCRNVEKFRAGLVCQAHRLLHYTILGSRVITKKQGAPAPRCMLAAVRR